MSRPHRLLLALASLAASAVALHAAPIVDNGSFETPNVSGSPYYAVFSAGQTFGGWTVDYTTYATDIINENYVGGGVFWPTPVDGGQFLYLADSITDARIHQDVALLAGHTYQLSFWLSDFLTLGVARGAWVAADLAGVGGGASLLGGPLIATHTQNPNWVQYSQSFSVATSGDYRLTFTSQYYWATNLDDVKIVDTTRPVGVPDSGATALLLGGAVAALALRRRLA